LHRAVAARLSRASFKPGGRQDQKDRRGQPDRGGCCFGGERDLDFAGDRLARRFVEIFGFDQPRRRSNRHCLAGFPLWAAADDRRMGPLDRDLGEPRGREYPTDIVGVTKGKRARLVRGQRHRRPQMPQRDVV
jgi:hypothetical protein